jgi:hypothetical protein
MSYALAFTADSRVDFRELDVQLQELALDELDRIAEAATPLPQGTFTRDLVHEASAGRHYLFMRLAVDEAKNSILVLGLAHYLRKSP